MSMTAAPVPPINSEEKSANYNVYLFRPLKNGGGGKSCLSKDNLSNSTHNTIRALFIFRLYHPTPPAPPPPHH